MSWRAHFDGGSRGNPGVAGAGAVLYDDSGRLVWEGAVPLGERTNNEAEYIAATTALKEALRRGLRKVELCGDSKLVINQLSGVWRIKEPRLNALAEEFKAIADGISVEFRWVPRKENSDADRMANLAMDGRTLDRRLDDGSCCPESGSSERKGEVPHDCKVDIVVFSDGERRYFVDVTGCRCSCDEFSSGEDCVHLKICRDAGFLP